MSKMYESVESAERTPISPSLSSNVAVANDWSLTVSSVGVQSRAATGRTTTQIEFLNAKYVAQFAQCYAGLYPFQKEAFRSSIPQNTILFVPTGGGKSVIAAAQACLHLALYRDRRVFFVVDRVALAQQQAKLLEQLTGCPVACVVGGLQRFSTPELLLGSAEHRVIVIIDVLLISWINKCPELILEHTSLIIADESHRALGGWMSDLFLSIEKLRRGVESSDADSANEETPGYRTPQASRLAQKLSEAALTGTRETADPASAAISPADAAVIAAALQWWPRDLSLPQHLCLTASPAVSFKDMQAQLHELALRTKCRIVGVRQQMKDLRLRLPQIRTTMLTYYSRPREQFVMRFLLHLIEIVFHHIEAFVTRPKSCGWLKKLRATPIASPSFLTHCKAAMGALLSQKSGDCLYDLPPAFSLLLTSGKTLNLDGSNSSTTAVVAVDFLFHALKLLLALGDAVILLRSTSCIEAVEALLNQYNVDVFKKVVEVSNHAVTRRLLLPLLQAIERTCRYLLLLRPMAGDAAQSNSHGGAAAAETAATKAIQSSLAVLPTSIALLMRLLSEFAQLRGGRASDAAAAFPVQPTLRVLVFVPTRDLAVFLCRLMKDSFPSLAQFFCPQYLVGQGRALDREGNKICMTKAAQTALLEEVRDGMVRLVFTTSVSEEGIDIPSCDVVVQLHPQLTLRSVLQTRGRVRVRSGLYFVITDAASRHRPLGSIVKQVRSFHGLLHLVTEEGDHDGDGATTATSATEVAQQNQHEEAGGRNSWWDSVMIGRSFLPSTAVDERLDSERGRRALVQRQSDIVAWIKQEYHTEVYIIQSYSASEESQRLVKCVCLATFSAIPGVRPKCVIRGFGVGNAKRAFANAFFDFYITAVKEGVLRQNQLDSASWHSDVFAAAGGANREAAADLPAIKSLNRDDLGSNVRISLIFLSDTLCLCTPNTWPPSIIKSLQPTAFVLDQYEADQNWPSNLFPQDILLNEVWRRRLPQPEFTFKCSEDGVMEAVQLNLYIHEEPNVFLSKDGGSTAGLSAEQRPYKLVVLRHGGGPSATEQLALEALKYVKFSVVSGVSRTYLLTRLAGIQLMNHNI